MGKTIRYGIDSQPVPSIKTIVFDKRDTKVIDTKINEQEIINFVGIIFEKKEIFVSFPKNFKVCESNLNDDMTLLFNVLTKHFQENQQKYIDRSLSIKTNYPFNSFYNIYDYYQRYGVYKEEERYTQNGYQGNVSWKETIQKSNKVVSKQGLMFIPMKIKKLESKQVFISECMVFAINYTLDFFEGFISLAKIEGSYVKRDLLQEKEYVLSRLNLIKNEIFKDTNKKLLNNLIQFFEEISEGGEYHIKNYTFRGVWETMIEFYLNSHFISANPKKIVMSEEKNKNNTKKFTKRTFHPNYVNSKHNIQPDHYLEEEDTQYIFDAKYYQNLDGINYKQIAYQMFLENYSDSKEEPYNKKFTETISALILPGNFESKVHFQIKPEFNYIEYKKKFTILEHYLDVKKVMRSYSS
ncbi:hypothetical protein [Marinilactibacillus sp. Marseille-P9653]|uniref:hypothetical protein n=1 Tax=Marinilactibacillus sp. Marseille-P9653 TaxID=2866583 RepID=UPI001CE4A667|nr:hypothetical protein [Marinilactibacillus sp. Marseille-P9653]